jgi:hypothetical protein
MLFAAPAVAGVAAVPTQTWQTNGRVEAIATVSGVTYIGGTFTQLTDHSGTKVTVSNLAALDPTGAAITTFHPAVAGEVKAVVASHSIVYAAGGFTTVEGKPRLRIAAFSRAGTLLSFAAHTNGEVSSLALSGGRLYAGGTFTQANGSLRSNAAAFNATTGLLGRWRPDPNNRVTAILAQPTRILLGGFFNTVRGKMAKHLAAVSPVIGGVLPWRGHPSGQVLTLAQGGTQIYAGVSGLGGAINRYTSGGLRVWVRQVNGNVKSIVVVGSQLYVGGHFSGICVPPVHTCPTLVRRQHLLSLVTATGALAPWNPEANSILGVYALAKTSSWVSVGGDFTVIGGAAQAHYARFALR